MVNRDVLIIDDTEANRYVVSRILRNAGYTIREAGSCKEGLEAIKESLPLLIVLDVQLPDGSGYKFCKKLKDSPKWAGIPVLMTSAAFTNATDKATGLDQGADGYLTTPVDTLELVAVVKSLLRIRETEVQLREAYTKAEVANNAKTDFLANMSHEIRTPMNAIIGLSSILANSKVLPEKEKLMVKTIQSSADGLLSLINDLLDISKIEAQSIELEKIPFNLTKLLQEIVTMMAIKAKEKNIELDLGAANLQDQIFLGDPTRLRQIFINLCSNAIKFTEQGIVKISVQQESNENISISIVDTGIGIPESKLATIFEKFTQGDSSINRKYGGTGLGLTITKNLAETMGGTITVKSEVGKGSEFKLIVPLVKTNLSVPIVHPANAMKAENGSETILLVEDYEPNVMVARLFLEEFGFKCEVAYNGYEAIEKIKNSCFKAILMDVQMHEMNGFEATRRIREYEKETGQFPSYIIGMTANAMPGDREKCIDAGMNDYISKPFNPSELNSKIIAG